MLKWALTKLNAARTVNYAADTMKRDVGIINAAGGSDKVCLAYVHYYLTDRERLIRLRCGMLKEDERKFPRSVIATAAINSMMKARRQIADGHDDEMTANRLKIAEEAFGLSWLQIEDEDLVHITVEERQTAARRSMEILLDTQDTMKAYSVLPYKKVCDERYRKGQEALESWRQHDPYDFTFLVDVEIKTSSNSA